MPSNLLQDELGHLNLTQNLSPSEVEELNSLTKSLVFPPGAVILQQGSENHRLYFLLDGTVSVFRDGEKIATLSSLGDVLGEMSLITQEACAATSQAETEATLLMLDLPRARSLSDKMQTALSHSLNRMFAKILVKKLSATNEKARLFEITNRELEKAKRALEMASQNKIGEMALNQSSLFAKLSSVLQNEKGPIREKLQSVIDGLQADRVLKNKRVLVAEDDLQEQINSKMSLAGTGIELTIAKTLDEGKEALSQGRYDIICVNSALSELIPMAKRLQPDSRLIFATSDPISRHLQTLRTHPELSTILSRHPKDRSFTVKNTATTVRKLMSKDIFGLEPYLSWGTDVRELKIAGSKDRDTISDEVYEYFKSLGIRDRIAQNCRLVAGELIMNAVYDAPTDPSGQSIYNHLDRKNPVSLKPEECGVFRYACDGTLLALSAIDPFGALDRSTIIDYLERCFQGVVGVDLKDKGGGGNGLFQIILSSSLVVFNVKPGTKTEVIALFNTNMQFDKIESHPSFHFFEAT